MEDSFDTDELLRQQGDDVPEAAETDPFEDAITKEVVVPELRRQESREHEIELV